MDDDPEMLLALATLLDQGGMIVEVAGSSDEALEVFSDFSPDLVLSDLSMPDHDGFEFIERLRDLMNPSGCSPRVVAMSSFHGPDVERRALDAGFDRLLPKPIDPAALLDVFAPLH